MNISFKISLYFVYMTFISNKNIFISNLSFDESLVIFLSIICNKCVSKGKLYKFLFNYEFNLNINILFLLLTFYTQINDLLIIKALLYKLNENRISAY